MKMPVFAELWLLLVFCFQVWPAIGQQSAAIPITPTNFRDLPNLISYGGVLRDGNGKALTAMTGVTFLLYKDQQGGAPMWLETQSVVPDKTGRYEVQLGAASKNGVPSELFLSGEAHWLAVQVGSETEQPRVLLVAVPYAIKAVDASTVGGLPPSAFVLAAPNAGTAILDRGQAPSESFGSVPPPASAVTTTTGGTANAIPMFTSATNIEKSILTQISTTAINVNGKLNLPATGIATATGGKNSRAETFVASAFNSGTTIAVPQTFLWQAEPSKNNSASASGTLNLLFAAGATTPAETGLKISNTGALVFAPGQTFPIASGGVTNTMLQNSSLTVKAGTDMTGGGTVALGGTTTLNLDTTKVPQLGVANAFTNRNTMNANNINPVLKVVNAGTGDGAYFVGGGDAAQFYGGAGGGIYVDTHEDADQVAAIYANEFGSTFRTYGVWAYSGSNLGVGVYGVESASSTTWGQRPAGVWGDSSQGTGVAGTSDGAAGVEGLSNFVGVYAFAGGEGEAFYGTNAPATAPSESNATMTLQNTSVVPEFVLYAENSNGNSYVRTDNNGNLAATGALYAASKPFKIDHPVDPANKYLLHTAIESPDMKNIYDGVAVLNQDGEATVELPDYFEALNRDFRYQLTAVGAPQPNLYVADEVSGNRFRVAGGKPGAKVSWQVTGIRHDKWANANRTPVEVEKIDVERGRYLHPQVFGFGPEQSVSYNGGRNPRKLSGIGVKLPSQAHAPAQARNSEIKVVSNSAAAKD